MYRERERKFSSQKKDKKAVNWVEESHTRNEKKKRREKKRQRIRQEDWTVQ